MTTDEAQYIAIVEICQKSQEMLDMRVKEVGDQKAIPEMEPYESMWKGYSRRFRKPVELRQANVNYHLL